MIRPLAALALALGLATPPAGAACRQALALGLDVSSSVDAEEYELQFGGLARALTDPEVRTALLAMPEAPVALAVYEWSGLGEQFILLDWVLIDSAARLDAVAAHLAQRDIRLAYGTTALGQAVEFGARLLARAPGCERHTLDISGDGRSNIGRHPRGVRDSPALTNVTVNALAIGTDPYQAGNVALAAYFRTEVIRGPRSFVQAATGFDDFSRAMKTKLLRELRVFTLSDAGAGTAPFALDRPAPHP